jgi:hypothetical protein
MRRGDVAGFITVHSAVYIRACRGGAGFGAGGQVGAPCDSASETQREMVRRAPVGRLLHTAFAFFKFFALEHSGIGIASESSA